MQLFFNDTLVNFVSLKTKNYAKNLDEQDDCK